LIHPVKTTKAEEIFLVLKQKIINNELKPGTRLVERSLCNYFESSRTPIRAALQKLVAYGLAEFISGYNGALVTQITYELISELYDIREVLEGLAARSCAQRIDNEGISRLDDLVARFREHMEKEVYSDALAEDIGIHDLIIAESRNTRLQQLLVPVADQSRRIVNLTEYEGEWADLTLNQHIAVYNGIRERKPEAAETAMREHIRSSRHYQLERLHRYKTI